MSPGNQQASLSTATEVTSKTMHQTVHDDVMASDFVRPSSWPTLETTLSEICLCLTEALPSAESAGIVLLPPDESMRGRARTLEGAQVIGAPPAGSVLIQIEKQVGEGPVLTAWRSQSIVSSGDLSSDERWRRFGSAIADLQLHSAVFVPLPDMSGDTLGVLSLYSPERDAFHPRAITLVAAMADIATQALFVAQLLERTRTAFQAMREEADRSRIVNQAVGILMRSHCTEEQARMRLTRMASRGNEDVADAARTIVEEAQKEAHLSFIVSRHQSRHSTS